MLSNATQFSSAIHVASDALPQQDPAMSTRGTLLCLGSGVAFGTMAIFGKLAYGEGATVGTLLSLRFLLAAALFWALVAVTGAGARLRRISRRDLAIAPRPRRRRLQRPGRRVLRRSGAARRVPALRPPLHVPRDGHGRRDRARAGAGEPPPDDRPRARLDRAPARPRRARRRATCSIPWAWRSA